MKLNKSGFVLAETLVVTVFLAIIFTMIYRNFYPLMGEYEKRENYNDVDGTYAVYWLKKLIEDSSYKIDNQTKASNFVNNGYLRFECGDISHEAKRELCIKMVKELEINGCDENGNHCDIFITYYRLGYKTSETDPLVTGKYIFKNTVKNSNMKKIEEGCVSGTNCLSQYCAGYADKSACQIKYQKEKLFNSKFKDYINSLPDYSTPSLTEAPSRVIAAFHHTKDNNDYYSYATIEVDRKMG